MSSVTVDFTSVPAKVKCNKCGKEIEIPKTDAVLSKFMKFMESFEKEHKDCE